MAIETGDSPNASAPIERQSDSFNRMELFEGHSSMMREDRGGDSAGTSDIGVESKRDAKQKEHSGDGPEGGMASGDTPIGAVTEQEQLDRGLQNSGKLYGGQTREGGTQATQTELEQNQLDAGLSIVATSKLYSDAQNPFPSEPARLATADPKADSALHVDGGEPLAHVNKGDSELALARAGYGSTVGGEEKQLGKAPDEAAEQTSTEEKSNTDQAKETDKKADDATTKLDQMYEKAPDAKRNIDELSEELAKQFGGTVCPCGIKSRERAEEKINRDYEGDPTKIKDLVRTTIIVPADNIDAVSKALEEHGAAIKKINGDTDRMGYSGINATIPTRAGLTGEIQVNSPEMIYGKQASAPKILGEDLFKSIQQKTGLPHGQGHTLYEQWRKLGADTPEAQELAKQSIDYYKAIRRRGGS